MAESQTQTQTPDPQPKENSNKKDWVAIFITRETRRKLALAKIKYGFRSYDEMLLYLLRRAGYEDQ